MESATARTHRFVITIAVVTLFVLWVAPAAQAVPYTLSVSLVGTGSGSVSSSPPGIACAPDCSESYEQGTSVTLFPSPLSGSYFAGWSGSGCSGTASCTTMINADTLVTATFNLPTPKKVTLTVSDKLADQGDRVTFKARVTPCSGHEGDTIRLKGGGKTRSKASNSTCRAKWRIKMKKTARFQAVSPRQDDDHLAGKSKRVRVRVIPKASTDGAGGGGNCDPSYPTVCIRPPPPDLDCADVNATNFKVVGSDPHGFDGDNDGVGCES